MANLSIIIATRNRAELLREALESVRQQSAKARIGQVVVSEWGATLESKEVCAGFSDLPILFFDHRSAASMEARVNECWDAIRGDLVAILHDDDWWAPNHLAEAFRVLESEHNCIASYAGYYITCGKQYPYMIPDANWLLWLYSGSNFDRSEVILDEVKVMLASLLSTTLHYSTVVARREAMRDAYIKLAETNNAFDGDRTFAVFLSEWGRVGYVIQPNTFVRMHAAQDSNLEQNKTHLWSLMRDTTRWLLQNRPATVAAAAAEFNAALGNLAGEELPRLRQAIFDRVQEPQWTTLVKECGLNLPARDDYAPSWSRPPKRNLIDDWCPPILAKAKRRTPLRN